MKGYYNDKGYVGWYDGEYRLFSSETEYREMLEEDEEEEQECETTTMSF